MPTEHDFKMFQTLLNTETIIYSGRRTTVPSRNITKITLSWEHQVYSEIQEAKSIIFVYHSASTAPALANDERFTVEQTMQPN